MDHERPVRWWPAVAIAGSAAVAWAVVWFVPRADRQRQVLGSIGIGVLAVLLALCWLLFASRLPWRRRILGTLVVVAVAIAASQTVRIRGVSGDVLPILEWRWTERAAPSAVEAPGPAVVESAGPDDYPQFLGPERTGMLPERTFATGRDAAPPEVVWRQPVGEGWSAFAVSGSLAVTQESRDGESWVTAYDAADGALLWKHVVGEAWDDPLGGPGPRATPTIHDGRAYALSGRGVLVALDLATGRPAWTVDVAADADADPPTYGFAGSPLVHDAAVVVAAGGADGRSLIAYSRIDGSRMWSGGNRRAGYTSPRLATLAGEPRILVFGNEGLTAYSPADGRESWHVDWPGSTEHTSQPVVLPGDRVFQSSGYGIGGKMFHVVRAADGSWRVDELWASRGIKAKFANVVHRDGFLYGLDDGILACVDAADGERRWKGGRYGHGQLILAGDVLVVQSEKGYVALVEATPEGHREIARIDALDGKTWNHPALAGRRLFVRNDREAARIDLPPR